MLSRNGHHIGAIVSVFICNGGHRPVAEYHASRRSGGSLVDDAVWETHLSDRGYPQLCALQAMTKRTARRNESNSRTCSPSCNRSLAATVEMMVLVPVSQQSPIGITRFSPVPRTRFRSSNSTRRTRRPNSPAAADHGPSPATEPRTKYATWRTSCSKLPSPGLAYLKAEPAVDIRKALQYVYMGLAGFSLKLSLCNGNPKAQGKRCRNFSNFEGDAPWAYGRRYLTHSDEVTYLDILR